MASNSPSRRPLKKRLLFSLVALLLCYALLRWAPLRWLLQDLQAVIVCALLQTSVPLAP